jgi:hypothetical protein
MADGESLLHPLSISLEYLSPLPIGPFEITLHDYGIEGAITTLRAEITTPKADSPEICSIAIVRLRRNGTGQGGKTIIPQLPTPPDRLRDCARWSNATLYYFTPPTSYIRMYAPKGKNFPFWSQKYGRNQRWQWVRLDRDEKFCLLDLPVLSDLVSILHPVY